MYKLTDLDRAPRTIFGKTYYWSADDSGTLHLISLERLTATAKAAAEAMRDA